MQKRGSLHSSSSSISSKSSDHPLSLPLLLLHSECLPPLASPRILVETLCVQQHQQLLHAKQQKAAAAAAASAAAAAAAADSDSPTARMLHATARTSPHTPDPEKENGGGWVSLKGDTCKQQDALSEGLRSPPRVTSFREGRSPSNKRLQADGALPAKPQPREMHSSGAPLLATAAPPTSQTGDSRGSTKESRSNCENSSKKEGRSQCENSSNSCRSRHSSKDSSSSGSNSNRNDHNSSNSPSLSCNTRDAAARDTSTESSNSSNSSNTSNSSNRCSSNSGSIGLLAVLNGETPQQLLPPKLAAAAAAALSRGGSSTSSNSRKSMPPSVAAKGLQSASFSGRPVGRLICSRLQRSSNDSSSSSSSDSSNSSSSSSNSSTGGAAAKAAAAGAPGG
ncbi:hypothetical protein Efla_001623 [Eimeria flavescens]